MAPIQTGNNFEGSHSINSLKNELYKFLYIYIYLHRLKSVSQYTVVLKTAALSSCARVSIIVFVSALYLSAHVTSEQSRLCFSGRSFDFSAVRTSIISLMGWRVYLYVCVCVCVCVCMCVCSC